VSSYASAQSLEPAKETDTGGFQTRVNSLDYPVLGRIQIGRSRAGRGKEVKEGYRETF
jgi:hypothetical protein